MYQWKLKSRIKETVWMKSPRKIMYSDKMFKNGTSTLDEHVKNDKLNNWRGKEKTIMKAKE